MLRQNNLFTIFFIRGGLYYFGPFFLSVVLSSCSLSFFKPKAPILEIDKIPTTLTRDYVDQLKSLTNLYLSSPDVKVISLAAREKTYLKNIVFKIVSNNELLLEKPNAISFYILKESAPIIFSLPGYQFFISVGLLKKYFKNESILISALTYEIIKSSRKIYKKKLLIPNTTLSTKKMASIVKIDHKERLLLYKWSFIAMRRSDYDATAILNWIQTMNKNTIDFGWQLGNTRGLSNDEFQFKSFLAEQGLEIMADKPVNSSRKFYKLRDRL